MKANAGGVANTNITERRSPFAAKRVHSNPYRFSGFPAQGLWPKGDALARINFQYEKRQKELARQKKKEEKRQRKQGKGEQEPQENPAPPEQNAEA